MSGADLSTLGLVELAELIRTGGLTSAAATDAVLAGLGNAGRALNATTRLHAEAAMADAVACDAERARGILRGPLHGVPLAHKDMFHRAGRPSEMGTTIFKDHVPDVTAGALAKLDAAGAIDVGRLNMVEFALGATGHNHHTGHPQNAWDRSRITGGSTSGGATAVAAGLVSATLGSDTGGSIRTPASLCGVVGLKATYGRVSRAGAMPLAFSLDHVGPLARSVRDAALLLEVIAGADAADRTASARPVEGYRERLGQSIAGLRITLMAEESFEAPLEAPMRATFAEAAATLRELGAMVETRAVPPMAPLNALRRIISVVETAGLHRELVRTRRDDYNATTLSRLLPGYAVPATDYLQALSMRGVVLEDYCRAVFADADILALPTIPVATPPIAMAENGDQTAYVALSNRIASLIGAFNYLGLPAISVPMGFGPDGMPQGLQLVAPPFAEVRLLQVAHAFERAAGLAGRRPPAIDGGPASARTDAADTSARTDAADAPAPGPS